MQLSHRKELQPDHEKIFSRGVIFATALMLVVCILIFPISAVAYVGPGAGITALGALWAVILAVIMMVGGLLIWPIRTFIRRRKSSGVPPSDANNAGSDGADKE